MGSKLYLVFLLAVAVCLNLPTNKGCNQTRRNSRSQTNYSVHLCNWTDRVESEREEETRSSKGIYVDCSGRNLTEVPTFIIDNETSSIFRLNLSDNNITEIGNNTFCNLTHLESLDLSDNAIGHIHSNAFFNLSKLQNLNLRCNNLSTSKHSLNKGLFQPLRRLKWLGLKQNNFTSFSVIESELSTCTHLAVLGIEGCMNCSFGTGFSNLTKLNKITLSTFWGDTCSQRDSVQTKCKLDSLTNETFANLRNIERLFLSDCGIQIIDRDTFQEFTKLKLLDLSHNDALYFEGMANAMWGLQNSTSMQFLNVNQIYELGGRATMLTNNHTKYFPKSLGILHIDLNKIETLEKGLLLNLPRQLHNITASGNRLVYDEYVGDLLNMSTNVTYLDISRQHMSTDPFRNSNEPQEYALSRSLGADLAFTHCNNCSCRIKDAQCIYVPDTLQQLKWASSFLNGNIDKMELYQHSKLLKYVNISYNMLTEWIGPMYGVDNITHIDLSNNYCQNVTNDFFSNFTNLTVLNISANFIGYVINKQNRWSHLLFSRLQKLEILKMSLNRIYSFPEDFFLNLTSLEYIDLSSNTLSTLSGVKLKQLVHLSFIDLSTNNFLTIQADTILALNSGYWLSHTENSTLTIDLSQNPLTCMCKSRKFVHWLVYSHINFLFSDTDVCQLPSTEPISFEKKSAILSVLDADCKTYTVEIACGATLFACIFSFCACLLVYKKRWRLRHLYYSTRRRHKHTGYTRLFEYDAFVSYAGPEGRFIKEKLVPALEVQHKLKIWAADKDSRPGTSIAENITHAIYNSRKVLIVFSRNYLKESWCDYELNMARMEAIDSKRKMIIFIHYEDIPSKLISLDVLRLIDAEESVEYSTHPQHETSFWSQIAQMITRE